MTAKILNFPERPARKPAPPIERPPELAEVPVVHDRTPRGLLADFLLGRQPPELRDRIELKLRQRYGAGARILRYFQRRTPT